MNKINSLFNNRGEQKLLSLYFCAGAPTLDGTADVILTMQRRGIAMVEVGIPFSDPMADGPVIQNAATRSLKNGMTLRLLFQQLTAVKDQVHIPLILMGYLNPIMQYGIEAFCQSCVESGVSGMIIPDLPFKDYQEVIKPVADRYDLRVIMLITPRPVRSASASLTTIPTGSSTWYLRLPSPGPRRVSTSRSRSTSGASTR